MFNMSDCWLPAYRIWIPTFYHLWFTCTPHADSKTSAMYYRPCGAVHMAVMCPTCDCPPCQPFFSAHHHPQQQISPLPHHYYISTIISYAQAPASRSFGLQRLPPSVCTWLEGRQLASSGLTSAASLLRTPVHHPCSIFKTYPSCVPSSAIRSPAQAAHHIWP